MTDDKTSIGEGTTLGPGSIRSDTFHLSTNIAERILIDHDGKTYEVTERGDGIALERVPVDDE